MTTETLSLRVQARPFQRIASCQARFASRPVFSISQSNKSHRALSTSTPLAKKPDRYRGVSPLRRTGPAQRLSAHNYPLPKPTQIKRRQQPETAKDHGLWAFFNERRTALMTPKELNAHGRAWTFNELRLKGWEDLHALWWVCMKESSVINTAERERQRLKAGFGAVEANARLEQIKKTQKRILAVLTERWYQWEDAYELAKQDPTVDLSGEGPLYAEGFEQSTTQEAATPQRPTRPLLTPQFNAPKSDTQTQP